MASWTLFGVDGRVRATFAGYYVGSVALDKAVVETADKRQALLDAKTGSLVSPDISLPGQVAVVESRIVLDEVGGRVWVFAKSKDGKAYTGTWEDPTQPKVTLSTPLEMYPDSISGEHGVLAWSAERPRGCGLVALTPGAPPLCSPDEPDSITGEHQLVAGRYWVSGTRAPVAIDAQTKARVSLVPDCTGTAMTLASQPSASRVLAACSTDGGAVQLALWSPTRSWVSSSARLKLADSWTPSGMPLDNAVVAPEQFVGKEPPYTDWLDLDGATIYTSPPLSPVKYGDYRGMPARFLAHDPTKPRELWVVDLAAGSYERIATDIDCKHQLHIGFKTADRVALVCATESGRGYEPRGGWTDLIDYAARTRTRVANVAVTDELASGRAAGLTLTSPMRVVAL